MKNWKTTLGGVGMAVLLCVVNLISKGTIDAQTLIEAAGLATVGALAHDGDIKSAIDSNPVLHTLVPLAGTVLDDISKYSSNPILKDIHQVLGVIADNTKTIASPPAAPAESTIINEVKTA